MTALLLLLAGLGLAMPTLQLPAQLQSPEAFAEAQPGTYRLVIKPVLPIPGSEAAYEYTLSNYEIKYRHGLVNIVREIIYEDDYEICPLIGDEVGDPVSNKINGHWYPNNIVVRPSSTSKYDLISGDGGKTWSAELRFRRFSKVILC